MFKLIFVFVISYISLSDACSCLFQEGWEQQAYWNSEFAGVIEVRGPSYSCGEWKICHSIAVVQQFRGDAISPIEVETASDSAMCGVYLTEGSRYFVATNPLSASQIGLYLCGLVQDWSSYTCCDMITEAKKYGSGIQIPIEETPVDPIYTTQ